MGKRNERINPQRKRARFTKEFKLDAVRLLERGEKPAVQPIKATSAACARPCL